LGGGIGYLSRTLGLTIDNLLSVDMVLADGSFVTASAEEHADLFWAVRESKV
jgi:FAD/FMN-containing dehydrogenase